MALPVIYDIRIIVHNLRAARLAARTASPSNWLAAAGWQQNVTTSLRQMSDTRFLAKGLGIPSI